MRCGSRGWCGRLSGRRTGRLWRMGMRRGFGLWMGMGSQKQGRRSRKKRASGKLEKGAGGGVCFDGETLGVVGGWGGGFVKIFPTREGLAQPMDADGRVVFSTAPGLGWARGEGGGF